jgi:hypothetical protein
VGLLNWARGLLGGVTSTAASALRALINAGISGISAVIDTVFGNVFGAWKDLAGALDTAGEAARHYQLWTLDHLRQLVTHDIPVFAQTASWWVSHPDQLARRLFWYLVRMLEDNAFTAARHLGAFLLSLAWHHADDVLKTAEDILDAVL